MLEAAQKLAMAAIPTDSSSTEGMVIDKATGAVVDNSIMVMAKRNFDSAKAKDKFAKGMAKGMTKKGAVMITKSLVPVENANGMAEIVSIVADGVLNGIDSIKPTNFARAPSTAPHH